MFKYFWMIVVAIAILMFLFYTFVSIYEVIQEADLHESLIDLLNDFVFEHEYIAEVWVFVFISACFVSFLVWITSLAK